MKSVTGIILASFCALILSGCGAGEPAPVEPPASQAAAQESASKWTPEQVEKFAELNKQARGEEAQNAQGQGPVTGK